MSRANDLPYVIDNGRIQQCGRPQALWEDEELKRRYLAV